MVKIEAPNRAPCCPAYARTRGRRCSENCECDACTDCASETHVDAERRWFPVIVRADRS